MSSESEWEEQEAAAALPAIRPTLPSSKKRLSKQMSMKEMTREAAWERRRKQVLLIRRRSDRVLREEVDEEEEEDEEVLMEEDQEEEERAGRRRVRSLTDEDLDELRGSIDLGFGFSEENGGSDHLRNTLPALDFYFAVNRQFSDPKMHCSLSSAASTPTAGGSSSSLVGSPSPRSPSNHHSGSADSWKILNPGDSPQHVKTRLRHWAQVVACSVRLYRQSS